MVGRARYGTPSLLARLDVTPTERLRLGFDELGDTGFQQRPRLPLRGELTGPELLVRAPRPPVSEVLGPLELDRRTVADDADWFARIEAQGNLPAVIKDGLRGLYPAEAAEPGQWPASTCLRPRPFSWAASAIVMVVCGGRLGVCRSTDVGCWRFLRRGPRWARSTRACHDGVAGAALVECGTAAIAPLCALLDDRRLAPSHGSEDATVSRIYGLRRCDYAYRYLALITGADAAFVRDVEERDRRIAALRHRL